MLHHAGLLPEATDEPDIDETFAKALTAAFELPTDRLQTSAARAYEELMGHTVSPLTRKNLR
jgi:hypothetical protein